MSNGQGQQEPEEKFVKKEKKRFTERLADPRQREGEARKIFYWQIKHANLVSKSSNQTKQANQAN